MEIKPQFPDIEADAFRYWFWWHDFNYETISKVSGVSVRTVQRWAASKRIPRSKALLIEQVRNGKAVKYSTTRGPGAVRVEYRDKR